MQAQLVWATSFSLATTKEMSPAFAGFFSVPPGTEMFHFPGYANLSQA
jgi:hypothetical protein